MNRQKVIKVTVTYNDIGIIVDTKAEVEHEPKTGKLLTNTYCTELWGASSICGVCGCSWQIDKDGDDNFCPNCGAKMER